MSCMNNDNNARAKCCVVQNAVILSLVSGIDRGPASKSLVPSSDSSNLGNNEFRKNHCRECFQSYTRLCGRYGGASPCYTMRSSRLSDTLFCNLLFTCPGRVGVANQITSVYCFPCSLFIFLPYGLEVMGRGIVSEDVVLELTKELSQLSKDQK